MMGKLMLRLGVLVAVGVGVPVLGASAAWGQDALGDGRGLDSNLREGTGGVNAPRRPNLHGRYSDAIITGNVGGLGAFRGDIDYLAPGEFGDAVGGDDTFFFRRQALPPVPVLRDRQRGAVPGVDDPGRITNPLIHPDVPGGSGLIRPGSGTTAGELRDRDRFGGALRDLRRDDFAGPEPGRFYDQITPFEREEARPEWMRDERLAPTPGRMLEVELSPLTGLRARDVVEDDRPWWERLNEERDPLSPRLDRRLDPRLVRPEAERDAQREGDDPDAGERDARDARLGARPAERRLAPSLRLGGRLDRPLADARLGAGGFDAAAVRERVFAPLGSARAEPGEDVYLDLLRRIDGRGQGPGIGITDTGGEAAGDEQRSADRLVGERPETELDRIAEEFARTRRGEPAEEGAAEAEADPDPDEAADGDEAVRRLVERLDHDLPPLRTMAGAADTHFDRAMEEAERRMEAGRFFDADASYQRASALRPNHPLALAGRVHAQLAAGMHASAAQVLTELLANHPEMIATRYEPPVLPGDERLQEAQEQLAQRLSTDVRPEPALLLAYVAYQRGEIDAVFGALNALEDRSGAEDGLVALLRRIWILQDER